MCIISLVHGAHANAPDSELQHNLPLIAQSLVFIMELSNGRAAEGGESTLWGRSGGEGHATQQAGGNGREWVWFPLCHSHLRTADEYNNLIQLQSLVSIGADVQKVTRGLFVLKNSWWIFFSSELRALSWSSP